MRTHVRRHLERRSQDDARVMTVSAHDVARVLRAQLPGVGDKKVHKLLYLCQGMHLAMLGQPMFNEPVHAYGHGPGGRPPLEGREGITAGAAGGPG